MAPARTAVDRPPQHETDLPFPLNLRTGAHPPLADNPKLISWHCIAGVILTGYHGMPRFGDVMSDVRVAEVTNSVRSHFGNDFSDLITPDEVADLRPPEDTDCTAFHRA